LNQGNSVSETTEKLIKTAPHRLGGRKIATVTATDTKMTEHRHHVATTPTPTTVHHHAVEENSATTTMMMSLHLADAVAGRIRR